MQDDQESMLVLHGFGQSIARCQHYNEHLLKRLGKRYKLNFAEGKFPATGFRPEELSWWNTSDVIGDLTQRRNVVTDQLVQSVQPADVIMGFSQGANLLLHCLERRPGICKVAVVCCGMQGNAFRKEGARIDCPVVFVFGEKDPFVLAEHREELKKIATRSRTIMHPGGHFIPQSSAFVSELCAAIDEISK